jgi:hypothetical protein
MGPTAPVSTTDHEIQGTGIKHKVLMRRSLVSLISHAFGSVWIEVLFDRCKEKMKKVSGRQQK